MATQETATQADNASDARWHCGKCGHTEFEHDQFRASGGALAAVIDVANRKFHTVTCVQCGYTEIYRQPNSAAGNVLDFLFT